MTIPLPTLLLGLAVILGGWAIEWNVKPIIVIGCVCYCSYLLGAWWMSRYKLCENLNLSKPLDASPTTVVPIAKDNPIAIPGMEVPLVCNASNVDY